MNATGMNATGTNATGTNATGTVPSCTPHQAAESLRDGAVLLDVRERDEWMAGRIEGAVHIPLGEVPARVAELPLDRRIVCVCRSGNRSGRVTAWLRNQGFDAVNLAGGMAGWSAHGLPFANAYGSPGVVI